MENNQELIERLWDLYSISGTKGMYVPKDSFIRIMKDNMSTKTPLEYLRGLIVADVETKYDRG